MSLLLGYDARAEVPPAAPADLQAIGTGSTIHITWTDIADNETGIEVLRGVGGDPVFPWKVLPANATNVEDTQAYGSVTCYRARAINAAGKSDLSNQGCAVSLESPVLAHPADNETYESDTVYLSWRPVAGATSYSIDVGVSCDGTEVLDDFSITDLSYTLAVAPGTYKWRARSRRTDILGTSDPSPCRTFTLTDTSSCRYVFGTYAVTLPAEGGFGAIEVTANRQACQWTPAIAAGGDWITIISAGGIGSGTIRFSAPANQSSVNSRETMLTVGNATAAITQPAQSPSDVPVASFRYDPPDPKIGEQVTFIDTSTGAPIDWLWNFSDGTSASSSVVTHAFEVAGTYTVSLRASNPVGFDTTTQDVTIRTVSLPVQADFSWAPPYPTPNTAVSFRDLSTGTPTEWLWGFPDGSTSSERAPTYRFQEAGKYPVILRVKNANGFDDVTHEITVGQAPHPSFFFEPENPRVGEDTQFTAIADAVVDEWLWDFGDGSSSTDQHPTHRFTSARTFDVRMIARNRYGVNSYTSQVTVRERSSCDDCVQLRGAVAIGGAPLAPTSDRQLRLVGKETFTSDVGKGGIFEFSVPPGRYTLRLDLAYADTIVASGARAGSRSITIDRSVLLLANQWRDILLPPPVVFIHGIESGPQRWREWADVLDGSGTIVAAVAYGDGRGDYSILAGTVASQLRSFFAQLTSGLPNMRVIAHSKGGLVLRVLANSNAEIASAVEDIILLGAPNRGTTCFTTGTASSVVRRYALAQDQVEALAPAGGFPGDASLHVVAGTVNLLPFALPEFASFFLRPCADSCDTNDGLVAVGDVFSVRSDGGLVVPYHHVELGGPATLWLLKDVIVPYYNGAPFPACGSGSIGGCGASECISGRGLAADSSCSEILTTTETYNDIHWELATISSTVCSLSPAGTCVKVAARSGRPKCERNSPAGPPLYGAAPNVIGYYIYRSRTPAFSEAVRIGFSVGFDFSDPSPPVGISYYFIQEVLQGGATLSVWRSRAVGAARRRATG